MAGYQDSQPDGPDDRWREPLDVGPKPHGFFEPNKNTLLDRDELSRRRIWLRLLNDQADSHELWWARLMRFLRD